MNATFAKLEEYRKKNGIMKKYLADKLETTPTSYTRWLKGKNMSKLREKQIKEFLASVNFN
jgi:transcriptional regulator with XRE-family HTH domain